MEDKKLENIRDYLKLKKNQEEDKTSEMINEIYAEAINKLNSNENE